MNKGNAVIVKASAALLALAGVAAAIASTVTPEQPQGWRSSVSHGAKAKVHHATGCDSACQAEYAKVTASIEQGKKLRAEQEAQEKLRADLQAQEDAEVEAEIVKAQLRGHMKQTVLESCDQRRSAATCARLRAELTAKGY